MPCEADMVDKQALGVGVDSFAAHNGKPAHDMVAAVATVSQQEKEGEDTMVAVVCPGASSSQRSGRSGQ